MNCWTFLIALVIAVVAYLYATLVLPEKLMMGKARAFIDHLNKYEVDSAVDLLTEDAQAVITWHSMQPIQGREAIGQTMKETRSLLAAILYHETEAMCNGHHCMILTQSTYEVSEEQTMVDKPFGFLRDAYLYFNFTESLEIDFFSEIVDLQQSNATQSVTAVNEMAKAFAAHDETRLANIYADDAVMVEGDHNCVNKTCVLAENKAYRAVTIRIQEYMYQHAVAGQWIACREVNWADFNGTKALHDPLMRESMIWLLPRYVIARGLHVFHLNSDFKIDVWIVFDDFYGPKSTILDNSPVVEPSKTPTAFFSSGWQLAMGGWMNPVTWKLW